MPIILFTLSLSPKPLQEFSLGQCPLGEVIGYRGLLPFMPWLKAIASFSDYVIEACAFTEYCTAYKYRRCNGKRLLLERHDIQLMRCNFLAEWKRLRSENRPFIYLDETWLWEKHWQSDTCHGIGVPSSKGRRVIVLNAGGENGFLGGCLHVFCSNASQSDYHKDIDDKTFSEWFESKLLPNLPTNSVIVMDNASYHSARVEKVPTSVSTKSTILTWLKENGVAEASTAMLKNELYQLVKQHKPRAVKYVIDLLAKAHGHMVLRTPPCHSEYNPMEMIWEELKCNIGKSNTSFKMKDEDIIVLVKKEVESIATSEWLNCIGRVDSICESQYDKEKTLEIRVDELISSIGGENVDTSSTDEESSDDSD